jgi:hypothetical protein
MRLAARILHVSLLVHLGQPEPAIAAPPPIEQRCVELGAACLCSEPMNWQEDGGAAYGGFHDPADSEGPLAKECGTNGQAASFDNDAPVWNSVPVPNRPLQASDHWEYVQRITHDSVNEFNWWYGVPVSTMQGTLCTRAYHDIGTLPWMTSFNHRIKIAQWFGNLEQPTQLEWQWQQWQEPDGFLRPRSPSLAGNQVSFNECRGAWCRIEYCLDYNGLVVSWRVRITKVQTGESEVIGAVHQPFTVMAPLTFADASDVGIANLFVQCLEGDPCLLGTQYLAFAIQTKVEPMDPGFWPGPAYEIEGSPRPVPALGAASKLALSAVLAGLALAIRRLR